MSYEKFDSLLFLQFSIKSVILTILWIPALIYRSLLTKYIEKWEPSRAYGRILSPSDLGINDNFTEDPPKNTMVYTLVLEGPLKLQTLRELFTRNVLEAKVHSKKTGKDELRYPELKQYEAFFGGHKFRKSDTNFSVNNHITEVPYSDRFSSISKIHQEFTNQVYPKQRSPWKIVLVSNYKNEARKTLLIYRSHHSLADAKSIIKIIVQCLGEKKLNIPDVQYLNNSTLDNIKYYLFLPFYYVYAQIFSYNMALNKKADNTTWKTKGKLDTLTNVGISQNISLGDIKKAARKSKVTSSAIIMAAVTGAIRNFDENLEKDDILCQWILPRPNHPDTLINHSYAGVIDLPTTARSVQERVQKCEEIFQHMRSCKIWKYLKLILFQQFTWFNPIRELIVKRFIYPIVITNIAGDGEGIQIGGYACSEMCMSCGPLDGSRAVGLLICTFSYKDNVDVTISARADVLNEEQTQELADLIAKEFQLLTKDNKRF